MKLFKVVSNYTCFYAYEDNLLSLFYLWIFFFPRSLPSAEDKVRNKIHPSLQQIRKLYDVWCFLELLHFLNK